MGSFSSTTASLFRVPSFLTTLPMDWVLIVAFIIIVTFVALRYGSAHAASWVLALPLAGLFYHEIPNTAFLATFIEKVSTPMYQAIFFGVIFVILFFLIYRMVHSYSAPASGIIEAVACGVGSALVTLVVWVQVPALAFVWHFGPTIQTLFGTPYALFWVLASFALLAFVRS